MLLESRVLACYQAVALSRLVKGEFELHSERKVTVIQ